MSLVRIARGSGTAVRGFDEYQVLEALRLMVRGPLGRPTLEREVGIGEASAKTLLRSLREAGLAERCGTAHCVTEKGLAVVKALREVCLIGPLKVDLPGDLSKAVLAVSSAIEPPIDVVSVHHVRDHLVARSCKPVVIGAYWPPETVRFPGVPPETEKALVSAVLDAFARARCTVESERGAALVLAPHRCGSKAAAALIAAAAEKCAQESLDPKYL